MNDRTVKLLLTAITLALWGLLLRPVFAPLPSQAADAPVLPFAAPSPRFNAPVVKIHPGNGHVYVIDNGGYVYLLDPTTLRIQRSMHLVPIGLPG